MPSHAAGLARWCTGILLALFVVLRPSTQAAEYSADRGRILFIGNSLTYFNNLPAVLDALSAKNGHISSSDMIVAPGATLTDWSTSAAVAHALRVGRYSVVVLQERGGDFIGSFGAKARENSTKSLTSLVGAIRHHGATPILLGTYQSVPAVSTQIEKAEGDAARSLHVIYVPVSERLRKASVSQPDFVWFASDGMHPGPDLTLLYALALYQVLYDQPAAGVDFSVEAPMYGVNSGLEPVLRSAASSAPHADTRFGATYESARVIAISKDL